MNPYPHQLIRATGRFRLDDGTLVPHIDITVELEQLGSGRTFLYCRCEDGFPILRWMVNSGARVSFAGQTENGLPIRTSHLRLFLGQHGCRDCFSMSHAFIGDEAATYGSVELQVTNLLFEPGAVRALSLNVTVDDSELLIELGPVEEYDSIAFGLRQTDIPAVTAMLTITGSFSMDSLDALANDLCDTLSVVQGRKIQWIRRTAYSQADRIAWSEFGETKTKNCALDVFCFDPDKRRGINVPLDAVTSAFVSIRKFRQNYDADRRIVNSWLDARVQADYLEARTLKYAVVLAAVCELVQAKHPDIPSRYVTRSDWRSTGRQFLPLIKQHLATACAVDADAVECICSNSNWGSLNRAGFRTILAECLKKLGISMHDEPSRIRRVTDVRNRIVHSFHYLTDSDFEELTWPSVSEIQQHFLVACFVDELILRLFGLGKYVSESWIADFQAYGNSRTLAGTEGKSV